MDLRAREAELCVGHRLILLEVGRCGSESSVWLLVIFPRGMCVGSRSLVFSEAVRGAFPLVFFSVDIFLLDFVFLAVQWFAKPPFRVSARS